jgi:dual specificity phosphatase 12
MDEIIPGLWIGDLQSAKNVENLKAHGIFSILTAMRGRITIHEVLLFAVGRFFNVQFSFE